MTKSTIVQTAEWVFAQRLLTWECPKDTYFEEFEGRQVWMNEFNFQLCCGGSVTVWAYKEIDAEYNTTSDFVVVNCARIPIKFSDLTQ